MSEIRRQAEAYLDMRRALGFKLTTFGHKLISFIDYLEANNSNVLTAESALSWATCTPRSTDQVYWSRRLMVVRTFARHLAVLDPATEIPSTEMLPHHYRRVTPHLYTPAEITALLNAAGRLLPTLRALTWRTLIGLLAVTGLRTSEACGLDRPDVELEDGILTIRDSKYGKHRQVPIHESTVAALRGYAQARDQLSGNVTTPAYLVSTRGTRLQQGNLPHTFSSLIAAVGIAAPTGQRRPRLHDLRHSFAVDTLLDWYRAGADVQAQMPWLSTYLGHADPKSTYWYLTATPELLSLLVARLDGAFGDDPS